MAVNVLKGKRRSTGDTLNGEAFCAVCLYFIFVFFLLKTPNINNMYTEIIKTQTTDEEW